MNFKTTIVLILMLASGAVLYWFGPDNPLWSTPARQRPESESLAILREEINPEDVSFIEIRFPDRSIILEKNKQGQWALLGNWPARQAEVDRIVSLLLGLDTRFQPIPLTIENVKDMGLSKPAVDVHFRSKSNHVIQFGESPDNDDGSRFAKPTYGRVDHLPEAIRFAPGIINEIARPVEYYMQRELFPLDRPKGDARRQVAADGIAVNTADAVFVLEREDNTWFMTDPVRDRVDPERLSALLEAVPDLWVERFYDARKDPAVRAYQRDIVPSFVTSCLGDAPLLSTSPLASSAFWASRTTTMAYVGTHWGHMRTGLASPSEFITVRKQNGEKLTVYLGKPSRTEVREVTRPALPFLPQRPPVKERVEEHFRFAKLRNNPLVFEVKSTGLKNIAVAPELLRDHRLARFKVEDVQAIDIKSNGSELSFVRDKNRWRLRKPADCDADPVLVNELLGKLAGLQVESKNMIDGDPAVYGLSTPRDTVQLTILERKQKRAVRFDLGRRERDKVYVRVDDWPRIDAVDDSVSRLIERPALAYRGKRVLSFHPDDLAKIDVARPLDRITLSKDREQWKLARPIQSDADPFKADQLAEALSQLEVIEYIAEAPTEEELKKTYGFGDNALGVTVSFTEESRPAQTLVFGQQRGDRPEYFAKLASAPAVFAVKKNVRDQLTRSALAFLPPRAWRLAANGIDNINIDRNGTEYTLKRSGESWRVAEPFQAPVIAKMAQSLVGAVCEPPVDRYEAFGVKDLAEYGFDKPYLRVRVKLADGSEHAMLVGKPIATSRARFAMREGTDLVFLLGESAVVALDRGVFDLLDPTLYETASRSITRIQILANESITTTFERKGDRWRLDAAAGKFTADPVVMTDLTRLLAAPKAEYIVAYGTKIDWSDYGLDKPPIAVAVHTEDGKDHRIALGKEVRHGHRYARADDNPAVTVVGPEIVGLATNTYLDFANRTLMHFDASHAIALRRTMEGKELDIVKREDGWAMEKPVQVRADSSIMEDTIAQLANLRGERIATMNLQNLKPFGLDAPMAVLRITTKSPAGKESQHVVKIGGLAKDDLGNVRGDRYALADDSDCIAVLSEAALRQLAARPLRYQDRTLVRFDSADQAVFERGPRKVEFAKSEDGWKVIQPIKAEARQDGMKELVDAFGRLNADELVDEKARDLSTYGLDRPEARWRISCNGTPVLDLLIGAQEKLADKSESLGPRRYARLAGSDMVFLLSSKMTETALTEYRRRDAWRALDVAQVTSVRLGGPRDSFTFEKTDHGWAVAGQPDTKVNADKVSDTLDCLARLMVDRFVTDRDADRKIHGLEPPQWTVEIRTRSGRRVLNIGRTEGDSKRYYATSSDVGEGAVFVLAEHDAEKILRDLAAYSK